MKSSLSLMKIELLNNKIFIINQGNKHIIHPFWLRERVDGDEYLDKKTEQRLFDPSILNSNIVIKKATLENDTLKLIFSDGIKSTICINKIISEFSEDIKTKKFLKYKFWDSSLKDFPVYKYNSKIFESKKMYELLKTFYTFGFVIINNVPTNNNFIVKFANSIGSVRRTNFGEHFNVRSTPNPNDLAYTSLALSPHTDNPYRKPVPCIQLLHCIENEVCGGLSTLVDGFSVANYLKKKNPDLFTVLTKTKVKFRFIDKDVILENWGELIEVDKNNNLKQIRFSTRLDYVPALEKKQLDVYYKARKKISDLYNSNKFKIEFKLMPGDMLMMDNYRTLHGRTEYNPKEGKRFLQGCYIDYDSSEGKLKHLIRKFKLENITIP